MRRMEGPGETGGAAIPRDMPDQQKQDGERTGDIPLPPPDAMPDDPPEAPETSRDDAAETSADAPTETSTRADRTPSDSPEPDEPTD